MRPRYLEIEGLHSFKKKQEIDFDKLGETGLFGIFGPTGSGKSTVLDAVTLALYGSVQRALRGTQGIINTDSNVLKVAFTFDLLKSGCRRVYRVERAYKRKKNSDSSAEAKTARLIEIVDSEEYIAADRPSDVTDRVEELLGLKLDDFTRAVVLPQNKFQEFLMMEKSKKREMLERIFYLEEYGRQLIDKVSRSLSKVRLKLSNTEGAISALGNASENALIEAESRMMNAKEHKNIADNELRNAEMQFNEAKEVWGLISDLNTVKEREVKLQSVQDEIMDKKKLYEDSLKAEGLVDIISKYRDTSQKLDETNAQLTDLTARYSKSSTRLEVSKIEYEKIREQAERDKPFLIEKRAKLKEAISVTMELSVIEEKLKGMRENYVTLKSRIDERERELSETKQKMQLLENKIVDCRKQLDVTKVDITYRNELLSGERLGEELSRIVKEKDKLESECLRLCTLVKKLKDDFDKLLNSCTGTGKNLDELKNKIIRHENAKPCERADIATAVNEYHSLENVFESVKAQSQEVEQINERLKVLSGQQKLFEKYYNEAYDYCCLLRQEFDAAKQEYNEIEEGYRRNSVYILAQKLKEGSPCPVCGSTGHPYPAHLNIDGYESTDEALVLQAKDKAARAEEAFREAENNCVKQKEKLSMLTSQLKDLQEELSIRTAKYREIKSVLPEKVRSIPDMQLKEELGRIARVNAEKEKTLEIWEQELELLRNMLASLSGTYAEQRAAVDAKRAELDVNKSNLVQAEEGLKECKSRLKEKQTEYELFIERMDISDIKAEIERIGVKERKHSEFQSEIMQLQELQSNIRREIEKLNEEKQQLVNRLTDIDADGRNLKAQKSEKEAKIKALAGETSPEQELESTEKKLDELNQQEKLLHESLKKLEAELTELGNQKNTFESSRLIYSKHFEKESVSLREQLSAKGFTGIEQAESALLDGEQKRAMDTGIKEYERQLRNTEAEKSLILNKLEGRNITEEKWSQIVELYREKQQKRDESISLYEGAKNSYLAIRNNFDTWVKLNSTLKEYTRKKDMLEQIQKLLKGNSFVEYISEERLRYVAREASETLEVLTRFKYALELDTENGFVIRDNANGGIHRAVSSLSGGETFLTSLSLALALSKQIQLKGQSPLEFFFLDEGFGTLDSSLLDTVMDSLGRISSNERVIGLISHVPQLKNRMARRLIVEPPANSGEGSTVTIEKA